METLWNSEEVSHFKFWTDDGEIFTKRGILEGKTSTFPERIYIIMKEVSENLRLWDFEMVSENSMPVGAAANTVFSYFVRAPHHCVRHWNNQPTCCNVSIERNASQQSTTRYAFCSFEHSAGATMRRTRQLPRALGQMGRQKRTKNSNYVA